MPRERVGAETDTTDAGQLMRWLDEERRRDKALLVELERRVEEQARQIAHSQKAMEGLEERLDQFTAEVKSVSRFDQAVQRVRDEILSVVQSLEERLGKEAEDRDRRLVQEAQARMEAVATLEQRIDQALKLEQQLQMQGVDSERLRKTASELGSQVEEAVREIKAQQERLLGLGERVKKDEESLVGVFQAAQDLGARFEGVEESLKLLRFQQERDAQQISGLESSAEALREEQAQLADELRRVDDRGKKQISNWGKAMSSWRDEAQQVREQIAQTDKQRRDAEQMLGSLDALKIQLEKDRDALQHMERTAEERQRQQLEEWRKENELLWLANDERWQQLAQDNARRDGHMRLLWETQLGYFRRDVTHLEKFIKELEKRLLQPKR